MCLFRNCREYVYFIPPDAQIKNIIFSGSGSIEEISKMYNIKILDGSIDPQVCDEQTRVTSYIRSILIWTKVEKMVDNTVRAIAMRNASLPKTKIVEIKYH